MTASAPRAAITAVPLVSASPSLAASSTGARPARPAPPRRADAAPSNSASPRPIITSAMWASGARSPRRPASPWIGTIGCTPRSSMRSSRPSVSSRMPEWPLARVLARISIMARTIGVSNGSPTPTAWLITMLRCKLAHLVGRDDAVLERAEAGGDAVDDPAFGHELFDGAPPATLAVASAAAQRHLARRCIGPATTSSMVRRSPSSTRSSITPPSITLGIRRPSARQPRRARSCSRGRQERIRVEICTAATHASLAASSPACTAPPS